MRRHVATFVAAALLLAIAGPVSAGDPAPARALAERGTTTTGARASTAADPTGRWIVVYKNGTNVVRTSARLAKVGGFTADRTFTSAFRGLTAKLSPRQVTSLRRDAAVLAVVPDEKIELAGTTQLVPTGINRINGRLSGAAKIDGVDQRVDADVAVVDTGIATVADLNVAGGYNCSTSNRALWRDVHGHGTHVAGTVGAIDNDSGVVGVAPGVRLWAVKILDDNGSGLLSWYVCGLDWIAAQRDPADPTKPLIESVNMSVTKWGQDDHDCGEHDRRHPPHGHLPRRRRRHHRRRGGRERQRQRSGPGARGLQRGDHRLGACRHGRQARRARWPRCFSWGSYDDDDSFANFSNFGSDVDIIAPGKCIWSTVPGGLYGYMSGTSMAAPHVAGAAALLKTIKPKLTPAEVKKGLQDLGTLNWKITSDPDAFHEKLLDVSRIAPRGVSVVGADGG